MAAVFQMLPGDVLRFAGFSPGEKLAHGLVDALSKGPGTGISLWSPSTLDARGLETYRYSAEAFTADSTWDDKLAARG
jgi:hypothetical protein